MKSSFLPKYERKIVRYVRIPDNFLFIFYSYKNESFPNKTSYSSFWSVEATDFKNVILNKIHWAASEAAEV